MAEKKYFWLKLKDDFFKTDDIKIIQSHKNGSDYIVFWMKLMLKSISQETVGVLRYKENIPYNSKLLSTVTDTNEDTVNAALILFKQLGMVDIKENGDIWLEGIHALVGQETAVAARMRKYRALKGKRNNVTKALPNSYTELELDQDIDLEKEKDIKKKKATKKFIKPSVSEIREYLKERSITAFTAESFYDSNESKGWVVGKNRTPMVDWKAAVRTWQQKPWNKESPKQPDQVFKSIEALKERE